MMCMHMARGGRVRQQGDRLRSQRPTVRIGMLSRVHLELRCWALLLLLLRLLLLLLRR